MIRERCLQRRSGYQVDDEESTTQPQTRAKELGGFDSTKPVQELQNRKRDPHRKNIMHLWEFLLELLAKEICRSVITWTRKDNLEFKIKNPQELARKWGAFKNRVGMSYETLSRSLRYYYKQRIIKKVPNKRLVYRFDKLPYSYEPGVTGSRYHRMRVNACVERKELGVTGSRYGHRIFESTEKQVPRLTESRHNGRWTKYILQEAESQAGSTPPQRKHKSAFTPVITPVRRAQSSPFIHTPSRPVVWYLDPPVLAHPLNSRSNIISLTAADTMEFCLRPVVPVKPVERAPRVFQMAALSASSSIPFSVIR